MADIRVTLYAPAEVQTFAGYSYDMDTLYNDYCGDIIYSLVGGDTAYLAFDANTLELTYGTSDPALLVPGSYSH